MENEKKIQENSRPIDAEKLIEIIEIAKKCMCKIKYIKNGKRGSGSGFFCKLNIKELNFNDKKFLMTNNHIIDLKYLQNNNELYFYINNEQHILYLENRYYFTNIEYDFTIIEIKDSDNFNSFYELYENIMSINSKNNFINHDIFIPQFPRGNNLSISFGTIKNIHFTIDHTVSTESGSSGSPILSLDNYRLIGIHYGGNPNENENKGIFFKDIIISIKIGGDFDISKLKLIKTIHNDNSITDLILLHNGKVCIKDNMGNIKIYDEMKFELILEIKSEEKEPLNFGHFEGGKTLVLDENDRIIFTNRNKIINIAEIIYPNKYNIIQKIKIKKHCWLFIYENYLIAGHEEYIFSVYSYKNNQYEEVDSINFKNNLVYEDLCLNLCYFENHFFKDWNLIFGIDGDFLYKKKTKKYKTYPIGYHDHYFAFDKNQIMFFEPSFVVFGDKLFIINLNKIKKDEDEDEKMEPNEDGPYIYSLMSKKGNYLDFDFPLKLFQYQNLDKKSIIYIKGDSILGQSNACIKDGSLNLKLSKERNDIKVDYFIRKDDLLFVLFSGDLFIYQF